MRLLVLSLAPTPVAIGATEFVTVRSLPELAAAASEPAARVEGDAA